MLLPVPTRLLAIATYPHLPDLHIHAVEVDSAYNFMHM